MGRKCPCCGKGTLLNYNSQRCKGVVICSTCATTERDVKWYIESQKPTKSSSDFISLKGRYSDAMNFSEDRSKKQLLELKLRKAIEVRTKRYLVLVHSMDGLSLIGDYDDSNLALAHVMTWLGSHYNQTSNSTWVGMYGDVIEVSYQ